MSGEPFSKMLREGGSPKPGSWDAAERALDAELGEAVKLVWENPNPKHDTAAHIEAGGFGVETEGCAACLAVRELRIMQATCRVCGKASTEVTMTMEGVRWEDCGHSTADLLVRLTPEEQHWSLGTDGGDLPITNAYTRYAWDCDVCGAANELEHDPTGEVVACDCGATFKIGETR